MVKHIDETSRKNTTFFHMQMLITLSPHPTGFFRLFFEELWNLKSYSWCYWKRWTWCFFGGKVVAVGGKCIFFETYLLTKKTIMITQN